MSVYNPSVSDAIIMPESIAISGVISEVAAGASADDSLSPSLFPHAARTVTPMRASTPSEWFLEYMVPPNLGWDDG